MCPSATSGLDSDKPSDLDSDKTSDLDSDKTSDLDSDKTTPAPSCLCRSHTCVMKDTELGKLQNYGTREAREAMVMVLRRLVCPGPTPRSRSPRRGNRPQVCSRNENVLFGRSTRHRPRVALSSTLAENMLHSAGQRGFKSLTHARTHERSLTHARAHTHINTHARTHARILSRTQTGTWASR